MSRFVMTLLSLFAGIMVAAHAQTSLQTAGVVVIVPAYGEVTHQNDEAIARFMVEEQNKDKAVAASRVNQKMKQGMDIIKRADPQAQLETSGYYTYPVYAEEKVQAGRNGNAAQLVGWRVGQNLEVTTGNMAALPATVAAAQAVLALNGLQFGLNDATRKKLEEQRTAAAYQDLMNQIASIAKAMERRLADATLETVDFEASGAYAPRPETMSLRTMSARGKSQVQVEEPSFEPGESTLSSRVVGKIRFR